MLYHILYIHNEMYSISPHFTKDKPHQSRLGDIIMVIYITQAQEQILLYVREFIGRRI